jgi:hypothetical protein
MDIESYTEFQIAITLMARPEVAHLENHVLFPYRDANGKAKRHFFDFKATMTDGTRTAIMVKSAYRYSQPSVAAELRLIARKVDTWFADDVVVMTEKHFKRREFYNAEMMHEMRWPDPVVDSAALRAIQTMVGAVRIGDLVEEIGHGGNGFRAIVRLIRNRYLAVADGVRISHEAYVSRCCNDAQRFAQPVRRALRIQPRGRGFSRWTPVLLVRDAWERPSLPTR